MKDLSLELVARYPLLTDIHLTGPGSDARESVPLFYGLLLALAESGSTGGCCVVVPDPGGVAHMLAALLSMVRLRREFDALTRLWADEGFAPGQRVKVNPTGHVYEYDGVFAHKPGLFKLREIGTVDDARSLPVHQILRLEPTTRQRPKGKLSTRLSRYDPDPIDVLLGIESWGNASLFRNRVLLLSSHAGFDRFLSGTSAGPVADLEQTGLLSGVLPWGVLNEAGALCPGDAYQMRGEPIVAVTHDVDILADACAMQSASAGDPGVASGFATGPSVVVSEGTGRLLRNLRSVDQIGALRKTIVLAGPDEREGLNLLADRGMTVWWASPDEMLLEREAGTMGRHDAPVLFGGFARRARNQRVLRSSATVCENEALDLAAAALVLAVDAIEGSEADEVLGAVRSMFGVLFRASERLAPYSDDEQAVTAARLGEVRLEAERHSRWMSTDAVALVRDAVEALSVAVCSPALGESKASALSGLLTSGLQVSGPGEGWGPAAPSEAILVRYGGSRPHIETHMQAQGYHATIHAGRHIPAEWSPDHLVVLGWLGAERFRSLVGAYPAPRVSAVLYPFEHDWMLQFEKRQRRDAARATLPVEVRADLFGLSPLLFESAAPPPPNQDAPGDDALDIFRLETGVLRRRKGERFRTDDEDTTEARYVGFVGDTFAWMTEGASLPSVTEIVHQAVDGSESRRRHIPRRLLEDLQPGDFVLFREGSDHDVTRAFAEQIAGPQAYKALRSRATAWREPLRALSDDPTRVHGLLREAGLARRFVTVQKWLADEDQIGPQDREDLSAVVRAAGLPTSAVAEIWEAIRAVRAHHSRAGHRITEWLLDVVPRHAERLRDGEARLDLAFGTIYVVEIEEVGSERLDVPARLANELQWDLPA